MQASNKIPIIWKILCVAVIVFGLWNIVEHPGIDNIARAEEILPVVIGAIGLCVPVVRRPARHPSLQEVERRNQAVRQTVFSGDLHEYKSVTPEKFPQLDHYFYKEASSRLEANGFKCLGDIENVTLNKLAKARVTFTRVFTCAEGNIVAGVRHMKRPARQMDLRTIELHSEFSDGTFLLTSNTGKATLTRRSPGITAIFCPQGTPVGEMIRLHKDGFATKLVGDEKMSETQVSTANDYIHFQRRLYSIQSRNEEARKFRRPSAKQEAARYLLEINRAIYSHEGHQYRRASPNEFPNLDLAFYEKFRADFESLGFRFLGDVENITLTRVFPHMRTFIRAMVSADGATVADAYHVRFSDKDTRGMDLETEFSDGDFVTVTTAEDRTNDIPGIDKLRCGYAAPPAEMLRLHQDRLTERLRSRPKLQMMHVATLDDCLEQNHRLQQKKAAHKQATGLINAEDLKKVRGRELTANEKLLVAEIERLKRIDDTVQPADPPP